ncbi:MAG: transposase [Candidatus Portnoybacteria bacterium]|nr:transposase [Candidatus Portnoybacteria bacterium]
MNKPKCDEYLYVQFLIAAQNNFTCTELSKVSPEAMAHDAPTRLLNQEKLTPTLLWKNVKAHVRVKEGYLIADDSVIDKPHSNDMDLVHWQYSGTRHQIVKGIGLETLLWTGIEGQHIPIDYRVYDKDTDGKTKNQHFQDMIRSTLYRGFSPEYILMDTWYTSLENLKLIDKVNWKWIAPLRKNRIVSATPHHHQHLEELSIPDEGGIVHLKAYGFIKVFKTVSKDGDVEYYATNDINLSKHDVERIYTKRWKIEEYHRGLKQQTGIAKCQARKARFQRNHIWCSLNALVVLELYRIKTNISWQEAKLSIVREAVHQYLLNPQYKLNPSTP